MDVAQVRADRLRVMFGEPGAGAEAVSDISNLNIPLPRRPVPKDSCVVMAVEIELPHVAVHAGCQSDNLLSAASHIEQTQSVRRGRPRIAGTRLSVDDVVIMHLRLGQSVEEIVAKYQIPYAAVHAALAYYYDHKAEVDQLIAGDEAYIEAFKRDHPSKLHEKIRVQGRG